MAGDSRTRNRTCVLMGAEKDLLMKGILQELEFTENKCIGCGLCASNCPHDAIKLIKIRDQVPADNLGELLLRVDSTRI